MIKKETLKNIKWIFLLISVAIVVYLIQYIFIKQNTYLDNLIYENISKIISQPITIIMKFFTVMGSGITIITITIVMFCTLNKKYSKYMVINLICVILLNQLLKYIFNRPRPEKLRLIQETGYSFPSGHSMISMAFYGLIIYFILKKIKNPYLKWSATIVLMLLIIGIGVSRIYLGVHYASDVLAGFCISIAYLVCFTHLMKGERKGETN